VRTRVDLTVEGCEHVPVAGPVLIASRHFHHQWDAIVLLAVLPRRPHFLAALDWVRFRWHRALLEWSCCLLRWPVVLRRDGPRMNGSSAYDTSDIPRYMRRASRDAIALLGSGACLTVFPEAFPNIDSVPTPKQTDDEFLPFRPGLVRLVTWAQRDPHIRVPIVPAGLAYQRGRRWKVTLRLGPAIYVDDLDEEANAGTLLEARVRALSGASELPKSQVLG
jgi:putative membrane protein